MQVGLAGKLVPVKAVYGRCPIMEVTGSLSVGGCKGWWCAGKLPWGGGEEGMVCGRSKLPRGSCLLRDIEPTLPVSF